MEVLVPRVVVMEVAIVGLATPVSAQAEAGREVAVVLSIIITAVRVARAIAHPGRREVAEEDLAAVEVVVAAEAVAAVDDK